jgi:hypothetical protein
VELDGVSSAMQSTPGVKMAAALLIGTELVGFVAPTEVSEENVKTATAALQPYYAVPARFVKLAEFPMTSNG